MASDIRYITVNGATLGYEVHSEASGKPSIIFVHGYSGRSTKIEAYRSILTELAEEFTIYALDIRGHGASADAIEDFSLASIADDIAEVVKELGLVDALYVGHSLGGFLGLYTEGRHPGTFAAMCLLATGAARGGVIGDLFIHHGKDVEFLRNALRPGYEDPAHVESHIEAVILMDRSVHVAIHDEFPSIDLLADIPSIQIPTLILSGAKDDVVPIARQHETAMALPRCKEVIFTNLGHSFPCHAGIMTAREIISFWKFDVSNLQ
ncbi:alpha/beta fold hydrolase [Flavisphingomonas formosensis]|uniref:alpha/beta fold hydrolase n=1 Tax=Flavisphingomonas formosensis TaxID=861534 RepID=UPI0012F8E925|nr:alpha/beta hydrolase [Sphingomonas formosensis]